MSALLQRHGTLPRKIAPSLHVTGRGRGRRRLPLYLAFGLTACSIPFCVNPIYCDSLLFSSSSKSPSSSEDSSCSSSPDQENQEKKNDESDSALSRYTLRSLSSLKKALPKSALPSWTSLQKTLAEWGHNLTDFQQSILTIADEVSLGENSLYRQVTDNDKHDRIANPEMSWDASVRLEKDDPNSSLCVLEKGYLSQRRKAMRTKFAEYIGVDPSLVDERDIPIVGIAASGGGYRAMVNTVGCLRGAQKSGLLDSTSYIAGISGSCWALGMYYSLANGSINHLVDHIKSRISSPFLHPLTLDLLTKAPTNRYLLSGPILKADSPGGDVSTVDVYGTLVASRLLVPDNLDALNPKHLKLSNQRHLVEEGSLPLPIYSVIRHDISTVKEIESAASPEAAYDSSSWQWFEMTPFEMGCAELGAWIPTWSLGRVFENGKSVERQPELSLTVLYGVFASAFCATLEHYYKELTPVLQSFSFFDYVDNFASSVKHGMKTIHPFPPATLPNFLKGLHDELPISEGEKGLYDHKELGFFDAGALLNIPYVPLFRRNVDVVIALDASADSQDIWFEKAEEFAVKSGLSGWPKVAYKNLVFQDKASATEAAAKKSLDLAKEQSSSLPEHTDKSVDATEKSNTPVHHVKPWNCWMGAKGMVGNEDDSRMDDPTEEEVMKKDGIALVYCPLLPGEGLENVSELWSTWKFDYKPEQTEQLINLAEKNFNSGDEKFRILLRGIWRKKMETRLAGGSLDEPWKDVPDQWRYAKPTHIDHKKFK